jgi:Subtilase family
MSQNTSPASTRAGLLAACMAGCLLSFAPSVAAAASAPEVALSPANNRVETLCPAPLPGDAACLGLRLVAKTPMSVPGARALPDARPSVISSASATAAEGSPATEYTTPRSGSLTPSELHTAYSLPNSTAAESTQTIGIVDAYNDEKAEADLGTYDTQFGLRPCTELNGCFRKVNGQGKASPLPAANAGWTGEISTDIETAHGVCPNCSILLVEATNTSFTSLEQAERTAVGLGATEISNSFGSTGEEPAMDSSAFNQPGIVITASAGDSGYLNWLEQPGTRAAVYPASSPNVVAVGGTRLIREAGGKWKEESVWNDGGESSGVADGHGAAGGGCSVPFTAPIWQQNVPDWSAVGCGTKRAVSDVSADADPYTGVAVYDSTEFEGIKGWAVYGGTSVASPIIAATFALAGGAHGVAYPARTLYENEAKAPSTLHDVVSGSNAECTKPFESTHGTSGCAFPAEEAASCGQEAICLARSGYDGPTGLGTPDGIGAFEPTGAAEAAPVSEVPPPAAPAKPAVATPIVTPTATAPSTVAPLIPAVSSLTLTRSAIVALNRNRPKVSQLGFAFTISTIAQVHVTLARRIRVRKRGLWHVLPNSLTIIAITGPNRQALRGHSVLPTGDYELTLTPAHGSARSLTFQIA